MTKYHPLSELLGIGRYTDEITRDGQDQVIRQWLEEKGIAISNNGYPYIDRKIYREWVLKELELNAKEICPTCGKEKE